MSESPASTRHAAKVLALLEDLKRSRSGAAILSHVGDVLQFDESDLSATLEGYRDLLTSVLDAYSGHLPNDSAEATHLRLVRKRLAYPMSASELAGLKKYLRRTPGEGEPHKVPSPPVYAPGTELNLEQGPAQRQEHHLIIEPISAETTETEESAEDQASGRRVDISYRRHLNEKRERIQKIQETLAHHVSEVIKQNEKFGVLLEVEYETLRQTDNLKEMEALRQALTKEIIRLMEGHHTLAKKLDSASKYLQIIETEGQHLNEELTRVHILSLTDELTELPNRRAFTRRLEDEVARVQRYGYPLSLTLIDMDSFKAINDKYGHAAGDEVLRNFSTNILTIFRHHDMVARYGGEEFAVLLPNTDKEGALRALEKVRKRSLECPYHFGGKTMPMPTFSAGISVYKPGETPGSLIERADKALYQAKRLGRNRIEIASGDAGGETPATRS